jgi:hypothetical protein
MPTRNTITKPETDIPASSKTCSLPMLRVIFQGKINPNEISAFRGAVVKKVGLDHMLYHNHVPGGYRHRYPLIQYHWEHGYPALVFLGEGVELAEELFYATTWSLQLHGRKLNMQIRDLSLEEAQFSFQERPNQVYTIQNWLALKPAKFQQYRQIKDRAEKQVFLEKILAGNIVSMAKGIGWHIPGKVEVELLQFNDKGRAFMEGKKMVAVRGQFKSNIEMPSEIGLGKRPSLGFGVIHRITV